jgi:hypothetical protein
MATIYHLATIYYNLFVHIPTVAEILMLKTRALAEMEKKVYKYNRKEKKIKHLPYKQSKRYTKMIR